MRPQNILFSILLAGASIYFFIKYLPVLSDLADKGASLLFVLLILLALGYLGHRVLRE
jgi:hypothetical protein